MIPAGCQMLENNDARRWNWEKYDGSMPRRPAQVCPGCQARCLPKWDLRVSVLALTCPWHLQLCLFFVFFSLSWSIIPHGSIDASPVLRACVTSLVWKMDWLYLLCGLPWINGYKVNKSSPSIIDKVKTPSRDQVKCMWPGCLSRDTIYNCPPGSPLRPSKP